MFISCLAWETVFKPFTMKICEVISIFSNYLWKTGSWKRDLSFFAEFTCLTYKHTVPHTHTDACLPIHTIFRLRNTRQLRFVYSMCLYVCVRVCIHVYVCVYKGGSRLNFFPVRDLWWGTYSEGPMMRDLLYDERPMVRDLWWGTCCMVRNLWWGTLMASS